MRILITGGRDWSDRETILQSLLTASEDIPWSEVTVVHGGARGADTIASEVATALGMKVEAHLADWKAYHKAAGPLRNQKMVDLDADVCLAFLQAGSKGTKDCIMRVIEAGIPIIIYPEDDEARYESERIVLVGE